MNRQSFLRALVVLAPILILTTAYVNCSGMGSFQAASLDESALASLRCPLASASLRSPKTIDQVTDLINVLPKPLSLPCLIENLPRPLKVYAINTSFSAQPAEGSDSPRILIHTGDLILTVAPAGVGKNLLEFGQILNPSETVKGELTFPITETIPLSAPYDEIATTGGTDCRICHNGERGVSGFGGNAYASGFVRPNAFNREASARLRSVALQCDSSLDAYRCEMLKSIFVTGQAEDTTLP